MEKIKIDPSEIEYVNVEFNAKADCPFCGAEVEFMFYDPTAYNDGTGSFNEFSFETETCECGAEIDFEFDVSISGKAKAMLKPADAEPDSKPGPNQLDLFTGKLIDSK